MSMDDIEKLHQVAMRSVADLHNAIATHTGVPLHRTSVHHDGATFCDPKGAIDSCDNLSKSIADMVAEVHRHDPKQEALRRIEAIDKERAKLVAKLEVQP